MPWLFAEPHANWGEWRNRMQFALHKVAEEIADVDRDLARGDLRPLSKSRVERYRRCLTDHHDKLKTLLLPLDVGAPQGKIETYLALRTRLPTDQGLNTYYANVHRDWAWGDEENNASLEQIRAVLDGNDALGRVLVLGAGAGRLAYDLHTSLNCSTTVALDFNPLLVLIARHVTNGSALEMYEFPIAPLRPDDDAVLRTLEAPAAAGESFHLLLGDALRPPFAKQSFDTVVTPWLIDVINDDLATLAARINGLLSDGGRWINFGSLAFASVRHSGRYSPAEVGDIVTENGFSDPVTSEATIPYMCSPASRHGRRERVFSFAAGKQRAVPAPDRHAALPDWLVTGKEPVPLTPSFRQQAMTTQIYSFIMSLIDGKRSIKDMAALMEKQQLMTRDEAEPAIRSFLTRMFDDSQQRGSF